MRIAVRQCAARRKTFWSEASERIEEVTPHDALAYNGFIGDHRMHIVWGGYARDCCSRVRWTTKMQGEEGAHGRRVTNGQLPPHLHDTMEKILAEKRPHVRCEALVFGHFRSRAHVMWSTIGGSILNDGSGRTGRRPCEKLDMTFEVHELCGWGGGVHVAFKNQLQLTCALPADARMHLLLSEHNSLFVGFLRGECGAESHPELKERCKVEAKATHVALLAKI
jgi:hypothetical protein